MVEKLFFFGTNSVNMSENFKAENSWFSNFWCWQLTTCQTIVQYQIIKIFFYFWGLLTLAAKFQTKLNLSNSHGEHKFCSRIEVLKPTSVLGSFASNPSKNVHIGVTSFWLTLLHTGVLACVVHSWHPSGLLWASSLLQAVVDERWERVLLQKNRQIVNKMIT